MKHTKLTVLSLLALAFARPTGFCTANTAAAADEAKADKKEKSDLDALRERLDKLEAENKALREAAPIAVKPDTTFSAHDLLIKGAGVDPDDVNWRIRAGLAPHQAVEVAVAEKLEREAKKKGAKK